MRVVSLLLSDVCVGCLTKSVLVTFIAWASRTLIVRKLKGLEDIIREHRRPYNVSYLLNIPPARRRTCSHSLHRRLAANGHGRLALRVRRPLPRRGQGPAVRRAAREGPLPARRPGLRGALHGARAVGQEAAHDREQRVGGDHPHAQLGVRRARARAGQGEARPVSGGAARGDRWGERVGV